MYIMHIYTFPMLGSFPGASLPTAGQKREVIGEAPNGSFRKGSRKGTAVPKERASKKRSLLKKRIKEISFSKTDLRGQN